MKLTTAVIFAKDLARMTAFYRDKLDLVFLPEQSRDDCAVFDAGGTLLALRPLPATIASSIVITDPPTPRRDAPIKLVFAAADVSATRERLLARGVVMFGLGRRGCDGLDPEGNVFQIAPAEPAPRRRGWPMAFSIARRRVSS